MRREDYDPNQDPRLSTGDKAEMEIYQKGRYAEAARWVDLAMLHGSKPCIGGGCDLDDPCPRHERTPDVVNRLIRRRERRK